MKLTESQLRKTIRRTILESSSSSEFEDELMKRYNSFVDLWEESGQSKMKADDPEMSEIFEDLASVVDRLKKHYDKKVGKK